MSLLLGRNDALLLRPSLLEEVAGDLPGTTAEDLHRVALSSASRPVLPRVHESTLIAMASNL